MKLNFDKSFDLVIKSEGGYVNDPLDKGGETNLGVTKAAWMAYLKVKELPANAMKELTKDKVKPFYKAMYWDKVCGDELPSGIDYLAFDFAVNAGAGQSAKFIQRAIGSNADGVIGPATMDKVIKTASVDLLNSFTKQKESFYKDIVARKPEQVKFLKGWLTRVAHTDKEARTMLV
jgi:lysozyme family protein